MDIILEISGKKKGYENHSPSMDCFSTKEGGKS
jgi:hypothetical protein